LKVRNRNWGFTELFVARFGADGWTESDMTSGRAADHQTDAGLLENDLVVVVGVAHGPPGRVSGHVGCRRRA